MARELCARPREGNGGEGRATLAPRRVPRYRRPMSARAATRTPPCPPLRLEGEPLARGAVRDIWDHPGRPGWLLKTIRERKRESYASRGPLRRWLDGFRLGPYGTFAKEYRTYLRTAYRCEALDRPIPIAETGGLVRTDRGLAQICAKVEDGEGGLAPTLRAMLGEGLVGAEHLGPLNAFVGDIYALDANVPDLEPKNVVWDACERRFVLVDGYGDKTLLPFRSWIAPLNRRRLDKGFADMARWPPLAWNASERRFALRDAPR